MYLLIKIVLSKKLIFIYDHLKNLYYIPIKSLVNDLSIGILHNVGAVVCEKLWCSEKSYFVFLLRGVSNDSTNNIKIVKKS